MTDIRHVAHLMIVVVVLIVHSFMTNTVTTSKYSWYNFPFKNLYEQFRRIANIYFLIISILQVSPPFVSLLAVAKISTDG